jgi:hypothetical protein
VADAAASVLHTSIRHAQSAIIHPQSAVPSRSRLLLALSLVAAVAGLIAVGQFRSPQEAAHASAWTNADCRKCHAAVWDEWEASGHARSFTSDSVQAMFQHFGFDRKCESCHAPEPVLVTGLDQPPVFRADDRASGVNCLSCHATADGGTVAAVRSMPDAPCRPVAVAALTTSQACAACHVAIHKDWADSRYAAEGKTCQACHMPPPADRATGRSHACPGAYDDALVRSGARLETLLENGELVARVTNHATGHNFPGERHNRSLLLQVMQYDAQGGITLARQALIKGITPFRGETSAEQIRVDDTFEARFPIVPPAVRADVQLLYKRFPWQLDREALLVHRSEVQLPTDAGE